MSEQTGAPLALYHEHPTWFEPLFRALERRGVPYRSVQPGDEAFEVGRNGHDYRAVFNRMSPSAYLRGAGDAIPFTVHYLRHLEEEGVRVVNGTEAFLTEISKARQLALLERLELPYPRTVVIHDPAAAPEAANSLRWPVVVKPNVGGSGAGIRRFDEPEALARAAREGIDAGPDGTLLVQEYIPPADGAIVRVEFLDQAYLYAIRVHPDGDDFNLCPADACRTVEGEDLARNACPADTPETGMRVDGYDAPDDVRRAVQRIARAAQIEVGGVEYVEDARDGRRYFYDINALSNFVADAPRVVGFDPVERLVEFLQEVGR